MVELSVLKPNCQVDEARKSEKSFFKMRSKIFEITGDMVNNWLSHDKCLHRHCYHSFRDGTKAKLSWYEPMRQHIIKERSEFDE